MSHAAFSTAELKKAVASVVCSSAYRLCDCSCICYYIKEKDWIDRKMMDLYNAMEAALSKNISVLRDARKRPLWTVAPIAITNTAELENIPRAEAEVKVRYFQTNC